MIKLLAVAAAFALFAAAPVGHAADIQKDGATVTVRGPIVASDGYRFRAQVRPTDANASPVRTIVLDSPGGLVFEGMMMADLIQAQHLNVQVPDGATCASACFMLFVAGEHKTVGRGARIGVHSATATGGAGEDDGASTLRMARYVAQLGTPAAIVGRMVETDSISMAWLSDPELIGMGAQLPANTVDKRPSAGFFAKMFGGQQTEQDTAPVIVSTSQNRKGGFFGTDPKPKTMMLLGAKPMAAAPATVSSPSP